MKQLTEQDLDARLAEVKKELMAKIVKPKIEIGKVYTDGNTAIYFIEGVNNDHIENPHKCYGINRVGAWSDSRHRCLIGFREATPQEWEAALIKEAERRGYKKGDTINSLSFPGNKYELTSWPISIDSGYVVRIGGAIIFKKGIWAEIIKDKALDESKLINDDRKLIKESIGCAGATALVQIVTVGGKDYQLTVNLKLV